MILFSLSNVVQNLSLVIYGSIGDIKELYKKTKEEYYVRKEFDREIAAAKAYVDKGDK